MIEERLEVLGVDVVAVRATGQYLALDARVLHEALHVGDHVDGDRFTEIIGGTVEQVSARWRSFRVFGEIVDLYWRGGDGHLALELEGCWNRLRSQASFPLYCGYEIAGAQDRVYDCHDAVLVA